MDDTCMTMVYVRIVKYSHAHLPTLAPSCVTMNSVPAGKHSDEVTTILIQGSHSSSGGGEPWGSRGHLRGRISPSSGESGKVCRYV